MGVLTFTRSCLKVLIGLKVVVTPRGVHTLSNFSLRPLTYVDTGSLVALHQGEGIHTCKLLCFIQPWQYKETMGLQRVKQLR